MFVVSAQILSAFENVFPCILKSDSYHRPPPPEKRFFNLVRVIGMANLNDIEMLYTTKATPMSSEIKRAFLDIIQYNTKIID